VTPSYPAKAAASSGVARVHSYPDDPPTFLYDRRPPATLEPLDAALWALECGFWPVLIHDLAANATSPGKAPIGLKWGENRPDERSIRAAFKRSPRAGVGMLLGAQGGILDVDVDDAEKAAPVLARIFPRGLPPTLGWENANGRRHLIFAWDDRLAVFGKTIVKGGEHYPGLEVRIGARAGESKQLQTVIPPSLLTGGKRRRWGKAPAILPVTDSLIADLAAHLALPVVAKAPRIARGPADDRDRKYALAALEKEVGLLERAPEGSRNERLNASAYNVGQFVGAGMLPRGECEAALRHAARSIGLGEGETEKTVKSGLEAGILKPRDRPEARSNGHAAILKSPPRAGKGGFVGDIQGGKPAGTTTEADPSPGFGGFDGAPDPEKIRVDLTPVPPMRAELIPERIRPWARDIAERVGCPLDYVAVAAITALATVVGRKVGIRPKRYDDWKVICNVWAAIVGRPGWLKSPALAEAMKPLYRLALKADERHKEVLTAFNAEALIAQVKSEVAKEQLKAITRGGGKPKAKPGPDDLPPPKVDTDAEIKRLAMEAVAASEMRPPAAKRYVVNDATVESLGMILKDNPNGVLTFRDELMGWLRSLDKPGRETDRQFYLEAWNGDKKSGSDRVGRGRTEAPAVCVSILGSIQPGPLAPYLRSAADGCGEENDGLISRFQLLVYPDSSGEWKNVDRWPDGEAKQHAFEVFEILDGMTGSMTGAEADDDDDVPFLRFSPAAQDFFDKWRENLENVKLRAEHESPLIESHLAKYRSLMPSLALIFHLVDLAGGANSGPVSLDAAEMAAAWCEYLESHVRRIYESSLNSDPEPGRRLADRIAKGDVPSPFTSRWVARRDWSGLTTVENVERAIACLDRHGWVKSEERPLGEKGGRPTEDHHIHPAFPRKDQPEAKS